MDVGGSYAIFSMNLIYTITQQPGLPLNFPDYRKGAGDQGNQSLIPFLMYKLETACRVSRNSPSSQLQLQDHSKQEERMEIFLAVLPRDWLRLRISIINCLRLEQPEILSSYCIDFPVKDVLRLVVRILSSGYNVIEQIFSITPYTNTHTHTQTHSQNTMEENIRLNYRKQEYIYTCIKIKRNQKKPYFRKSCQCMESYHSSMVIYLYNITMFSDYFVIYFILILGIKIHKNINYV